MVGSAMQIPIDRKSPVPLARQIQAQLERLIREGVLAPGLKLPASRDLARTLGVNRATVVLAYEELVAAGWVRSHVGQGTFVLESVRPRVAVAAAPAVAPRNGDGHGPTRGPLNWSAFFSRSALIVNGSQQGFDLIARTFLDPGDAVAIEQPTYPRAMQVFRAFGAQLLGTPWTPAGPDVEALERLLARRAPKLLYCQPTCHNPTGLTMSGETAERLLAIAARHQVPVVEDGFDASLYYGTRPPRPLKARDREGVVVYIGTFSKILFPGLRLGWLLAPPPVMERLAAAKQLADLHTSALLQAAVHRFCERRLLERHATRVAREYARRRTLLLDALGHRLSDDVIWTVPQGGFSLLLTLPAGMSANALLPTARPRGVAFTPGTPFFLDEAGERTLRPSFSSGPSARVDAGVRRPGEGDKDVRRQPRVRNAERATVPLV